MQSQVLPNIALFLPPASSSEKVEKMGDDIFIHPSKGDAKRCKLCMTDAMGVGEKKKKDTFGKIRTRCQMCSNPTCNLHYSLVCNSCTLSLRCESEIVTEPPLEEV